MVKSPLLETNHPKKVEMTTEEAPFYGVEDTPPWPLTIALGFQHFLTALGGTVSLPLILAQPLCMDEDLVGFSWLISTYFVVSGVATLIQCTFGVRCGL